MKWRIVLVPFAFVVVGVVRLIARWKLVRFGEVYSSRLGHLVGNTECYLGEKKDSFDIWYFQKKVSHKLIARKYAKILHVWPRNFVEVVVIVNNLFQGWQKYIAASEQFDRDIHNTWKKPHICLTKEERKEGRRILKALGVPRGTPWVCLIVRDSSYMKSKFKEDFSYHDFRDADIDDYMQAAVALAKRGFYVIRMGDVVASPLKLHHPRIIDYVHSEHKSELGTLFLGAGCEFCFGTSTGFMAIPQVFQRPCAVTDFVPIEYISTFCRDRVIWKHHWKDGREMTFDEIIASGAGQFLHKDNFKEAGISLKNNTPEEITELVLEMLEEPEDQTDFWNEFPKAISPYNGKPLHGKMLARLGNGFHARLQAYRKILEKST